MAAASKPSKLIFAPGEAPSDAHDPSTDTNHQQAAQFKLGTLTQKDLDPNPFVQFHKWFSHPALQGTTPETVTLSTAELPSGRVSNRMVYLKELDETGFVIYSNWGTSQKAHDIQTNPHAALCFWWKPLERQVRISGPAHRLTQSESQTYFDTRARGSRIGAWASQQSKVLPPSSSSSTISSPTEPSLAQTNATDTETEKFEDDGRALLESQVQTITEKFANVENIPVPEFWGGLRVVPERIEFWQGRESRLHDRFEYVRKDVQSTEWMVRRLSP